MDLEGQIFEDTQDALPPEFDHMTADDVKRRTKLLENEIRVLKDESARLNNDIQGLQEKVSWCLADLACNPLLLSQTTKSNSFAALEGNMSFSIGLRFSEGLPAVVCQGGA